MSAMYTLPGQVELLDDAWLDRARRFLERELPAARPAAFSLSECFVDAPPHLGLDGDRASWTLRWSGDAVAVERGFDADADVVVEGDYQAALTAAQQVGFERPGGADAAWREVVQQFGKDAVRVSGRLVDDTVSSVLLRLHDHLARHTVENPDIAHRATRQGLVDHLRHMEEHGYTVIERAISTDFADEIRETTLRVLAEHGVSTLNWMLYQGRCFELLAQQPQLLTLVDASLGRGAVIGSFSAIRKGPGPGTIPLHTDYAHVPEPYPEWAMTGVGVWAFEDWTEASGPTWIVPGSHRLRRGPRPGEAAEGGIPIEMPKGSVVFFTEGVWHWQGDRTEPGDRVTLHWHFNRGILRSLEPKKSDEQLLHRNPPRLGEMLGQHDWFDKMSGIGRDYEKFGHMLQLHSFTKKQLGTLLDGPSD
jgi:ectoine hydroxylase-related dioxygenase (phytanoyl-CoA dioxygenase family)